jgi:hypothetical protein
MASAEVIKVRCDACRNVKRIKAIIGSDEDQDLLVAEAGERVKRDCTTCGDVTDHEVLAQE